MWSTPIGRLRAIGLLEGSSFVLLLAIAMPLKYVWGEPLAVRIVGSAHGALFVAYVAALALAARAHDWPVARSFVAFVAAWLPLGTFFLDGSLRREDEGHRQRSTPAGTT